VKPLNVKARAELLNFRDEKGDVHVLRAILAAPPAAKQAP
jgi:hypothetical protein